MKTYCKNADADFLIYFCVMISRKVIDAIGYLDEAFFSYAEDTDHCLRAVNAGFKLYQVPSETNEYYEDKRMKGAFPIFHEGNVSHKDWKDGDKLLAKNGAILRERYNNKKRVTVGIPTKNRYDCLINTLLSIAMQSSKPHEIIIIDDSDKPVDLRTLPNYLYAFKLLDDKKIKWRILFGKKSGQHHSHQTIQELAEGDYIFRIDDDCIAEPTVIEELLSKMVEGVGAVAPLVLTPSASQIPVHAKNKITDMSAPNIQWFKWEGVELCDHLYSCYLYRKGVAKYDLTLSNKANREETIHSHLIKRAGYKLLVNAGAVVHHFRSEIGGIRSDNNIQDYDNDEKIFQSYLNEWNVQSDTKVCVIVGGIGDHYAYKNILPELRNRYKKIVVGACYPDVFFDEMDIELISIEDAKERFGSIDKFNIYRRMDEWNWKENITEAYKKLYL
jgi:glycosyltransferase involved in cell wall biosynthesis